MHDRLARGAGVDRHHRHAAADVGDRCGIVGRRERFRPELHRLLPASDVGKDAAEQQLRVDAVLSDGVGEERLDARGRAVRVSSVEECGGRGENAARPLLGACLRREARGRFVQLGGDDAMTACVRAARGLLECGRDLSVRPVGTESKVSNLFLGVVDQSREPSVDVAESRGGDEIEHACCKERMSEAEIGPEHIRFHCGREQRRIHDIGTRASEDGEIGQRV